MGSSEGRAGERLKGERSKVQKDSWPWRVGALKSLGQRKGVPREVGTLEERRSDKYVCVAQVRAANGWAFMMTGRLFL